MKLDDEWRERVQTASRKAGASMRAKVDEVERCEDYGDKPVATDDVRQFMTVIRNLLDEGLRASEFDQRQADHFTRDVSLVSTAVFAMLDSIGDTSAGTGESCTNRCRRERSSCIKEECGSGRHDWPCFCCIPCNTTWLACLGDCILSVHAFPFGVYAT